MATQSKNAGDDELARQFAEGAIDLTELNERAADAGAAATTAAEPADRDRDRLADATPPKR